MSRLKSCHCCGLIQQVPGAGGAICLRCDTALESWLSQWTGNRLAAAFAVAGIILYLPAMVWPFLRIEQLGQTHESSLLVGVRTLFTEGHLLVGAIVLLFSVVLPVFKLGALLFLSQRRWQLRHRHRALTYRIVEQLGRWGMLDVLLVAVMVAFIKLGGLVEFAAGPGLAMFAVFVLLSLCASAFFDPYCLWDEGEPMVEPVFSSAHGDAGPAVNRDASSEPESEEAGKQPDGPASAGRASPEPSADADQPPSLGNMPTAKLPPQRSRKEWSPHWVWIIPGLALLLVVWVIWSAIANQGREIRISFADGRGIKAGDELRYRGIVAGEVDRVSLSDQLEGVIVQVRLTPQADHLAGEGSRFWIVRPQAGITGITGLETVVGDKYLTVQPGPVDAVPRSEFVGLEDPPVPDLQHTGGVEVTLESQQATGLRPGLGVFYRSVRIGGILATGLAADGSAVETRVYIRPAYRHLIRRDTKFWNAGGVHMTGGLTELSLHIGTLETVLHGGVAIAVPPSAGPESESGARFDLHNHPEKEWLDWEPSVDNRLLAVPGELPRPQLATLTWKHDGLLRNPARRRTGWVLPVEGTLVGPRDLLALPDGLIDGSARLLLAGRSLELDDNVQAIGNHVARRASAADTRQGDADAAAAPLQLRRITAPEDGFLITGGDQPPLLIAAARYEAGPDEGWAIEPSIPLDTSHHGGVIVATADGAVIGCLIVQDRQGRVYPVMLP